MKLLSILASALALSALAMPLAQAADLDIIPASAGDAYVPVEVGNGWYLRGDISYDLKTKSSGNYRVYSDLDPDPAVTAYGYSTLPYDKFSIQSGHPLSGGFGYQFNSFLRADVTGAFWKRGFNGTDTDSNVCGDPVSFPTAVGCRSTETTKAAAWEVMANGYADLGTYVGITPYLGGGVGFTHIKYGSVSSLSQCVDASGNVLLACGPAATTHEGLASWRFTWALMAGASYDLSRNVKLDLGYRYSRVKGGNMYGFDAGSTALGATGVQGTDSGFSTHEIKAGVRYSLW